MRESFKKVISKEKYFHLENGVSFGSVEEFYKSIDSIDDRIFNSHIYNDDFSKWIRDVFLDKEAYNELTWAKSKKDFKDILKKWLYPEEIPAKRTALHVLDPDKNKDISVIVEEDKKNLLAEKTVFDKGKSEFNGKYLDYLLRKAENELDLKDYQNAYLTFDQASSLYPEDDSLRKKMDNAKNLLKKMDESIDEKNNVFLKEEKTFSDKLDELKTRFEGLHERIKNARKAGKDMYIAELNAMSFKAKIGIAKITREEKDVSAIKSLLSDLEKEIVEAETEKVSDVYKEINLGAKALIEEDIKKQITEKI